MIFLMNISAFEYIDNFFYSLSACCEALQIIDDRPLRKEPQCNFSNRSCRRSYDTDGSSIRYTTTGFGVQTQTPQQSQQSQQQHKS